MSRRDRRSRGSLQPLLSAVHSCGTEAGCVLKSGIGRGAVRGLLIGWSLLASGGCGTVWDGYGHVNRLGDESFDVDMPSNAPSIWRGFHPASPRGSHKAPPSDHFGLDILGRAGLHVIAPAPGVVVRSYFEPMYGNRIDIDHGVEDGGRRIVTRYLHLRARLVEKGDRVDRGTPIGEVGRTGLLSGGLAHLHFELRRQEAPGRLVPVDPHLYWIGGVGRVTCFNETRRWPEHPLRMTYPVVCFGPE